MNILKNLVYSFDLICSHFSFQVVVSPASYASFAGIIGCVFYALAAGIPVMIIAFFGHSVSDRYPNCQSVGDFIHIRYGPTARLLVSFLTLFNMCIALLAEYTTIGSLFQGFVGTVNYPIIIVVGVITMVYTAYGGLLVSIATDQAPSRPPSLRYSSPPSIFSPPP